MKDNQTKERFIQLRAEGLSLLKIAQKLKVSKQTIINWSKEYHVEISNMQTIRLDELQEEFYLSKCRRIELFGQKLLQIEAELQKRDLSEIKTEKLFELFDKFARLLCQEYESLEFLEKVNLEDSFDFSSIKRWSI